MIFDYSIAFPYNNKWYRCNVGLSLATQNRVIKYVNFCTKVMQCWGEVQLGWNINRCTLHFVISFYIELKVFLLLIYYIEVHLLCEKKYLLNYTNLSSLHSQHWQLRTDHISSGMPFFEIFPEFKKDVKRYNFVTHIEETCRKRETEGRNIICKNMCSLESKVKNKRES